MARGGVHGPGGKSMQDSSHWIRNGQLANWLAAIWFCGATCYHHAIINKNSYIIMSEYDVILMQ